MSSSFNLFHRFSIPFKQLLHPFLDLDLVGPAEGMKFGDIDAFARGAIRLGGIETHLTIEPDSPDNQLPTTP
jgi:hypothetical protein